MIQGSFVRELLTADSLCIRYNGLAALEGISLVVNEGECLGVFGLSGAGKTVLLRAIAGEVTPDSGTVSRDAARVGFSRQTPFLNEMLTPSEALWLHGSLYGIPRGKRRSAIREVLTLVGLETKRAQQIRTLTPSERQLVEIARALMCPSDILVLDEPMASLDFDMRRRLWEHLLRLRAHERKGVVIATSRPEDAELCDRIMLMHYGRALATGTPAELRGVIGQEAFVVRPVGSKRTPATKAMWNGIVEMDHDDCSTIEVNPDSPPTELLRQIPYDVSAIRMTRKSLVSVLEEFAVKTRDKSR